MPDFRSSSHRQSVRAAFCGMAAALSAVIMLLGGVIPLAVYAVPMLCGLILLPILLEFDATTAWITYGVTAVIALLLDFDKEAAFFYGFMGYYPIVKWRFDRMRPKARRVGAKALLFTAAMALMYGLLFLIFPMHRAMEEFREMGVVMTVIFFIAYIFSMLVYDRLLNAFIFVYANKIRPKLKFLRR